MALFVATEECRVCLSVGESHHDSRDLCGDRTIVELLRKHLEIEVLADIFVFATLLTWFILCRLLVTKRFSSAVVVCTSWERSTSSEEWLTQTARRSCSRLFEWIVNTRLKLVTPAQTLCSPHRWTIDAIHGQLGSEPTRLPFQCSLAKSQMTWDCCVIRCLKVQESTSRSGDRRLLTQKTAWKKMTQCVRAEAPTASIYRSTKPSARLHRQLEPFQAKMSHKQRHPFLKVMRVQDASATQAKSPIWLSSAKSIASHPSKQLRIKLFIISHSFKLNLN